jgi:hypothetical protein
LFCQSAHLIVDRQTVQDFSEGASSGHSSRFSK